MTQAGGGPGLAVRQCWSSLLTADHKNYVQRGKSLVPAKAGFPQSSFNLNPEAAKTPQ